MAKNIKEYYQAIDGSVTIEYDDLSITKGSPVISITSARGMEFNAAGVAIPVLTANAAPPEHFHDDLVIITATSPVKCGGGVLNRVSCVAGSAITLTIKDSPHDSTGRTIYTATLSAGDVAYPNEVAINGMYASFTGTATFELGMSEVL